MFDAYVDPDTQRELYADDETPIVELEEFGHPSVGSRWTISFGASKEAMVREISVFEVVERPARLVSTSTMTMLDGTVLQTKFEMTLQERDGKTLVTMVMSWLPERGGSGHILGGPARLPRPVRGGRFGEGSPEEPTRHRAMKRSRVPRHRTEGWCDAQGPGIVEVGGSLPAGSQAGGPMR